MSILHRNTSYAAGTVDGVYPRPVPADKLSVLAVHEAATHATHVSVSLSNWFKGDEYQHDCVGSIHGDDYSTVRGTMNESVLGYGEISFSICPRYTVDTINIATESTAVDLVMTLMQKGVKGTLSFTFKSYPNGHHCYATVEKEINILL